MNIEQLQEGLKFGRKEIALVQQEARDIRIGLELEYFYNEDWVIENGYEGLDDASIAKIELESGNVWGVDPNDIEQITSDGSIKFSEEKALRGEEPDGGVEVISNPLPLPDAIRFMEAMFDHINEYGETDETTGLHVNMSFRGLSFDDHQFDAFKLVVLLDETYMIKNVRYPVRKFVDEMLTPLDNKRNLLDLAWSYIEGGHKKLFLDFKKLINLDVKSQGISFVNALGPYNPDDFEEITEERRRIEFRYIGGTDYHKRTREIIWDIYRYAYITMISFVPDFAKREYEQKIIQILNRRVNKFVEEKTFFDLVSVLQKEMARAS